MMRTFFRIYWGPILAIIAFLAIAVLMTGRAHLQTICSMLQDPAWWADATFSVIVVHRSDKMGLGPCRAQILQPENRLERNEGQLNR